MDKDRKPAGEKVIFFPEGLAFRDFLGSDGDAMVDHVTVRGFSDGSASIAVKDRPCGTVPHPRLIFFNIPPYVVCVVKERARPRLRSRKSSGTI